MRRACGASQFDSERHRARICSARISIETRTIADGANRVIFRYGLSFPGPATGRSGQLCPGNAGLDFLGDLERIIDPDAQVPNGAFV